jgi:hypothetical protein
MARCYDGKVDLGCIALDLSEPLRSDTFEHVLRYLIDHECDRSHFDAWYRNGGPTVPAHPPAMLLEVVLLGDSRCMPGSRRIACGCARGATFMALSDDRQPHFTTIAHFASTPDDDIATVLGAVLAVCQGQVVIGNESCALDCVKLTSNRSEHKSGTRADFGHQATECEATAKAPLARRPAADGNPAQADDTRRRIRKIARLQRDAGELRDLLSHADRRVRLEAQFALVGKAKDDQNAAARKALQDVAAESDHQLARLHAIWGLGQLGASEPVLVGDDDVITKEFGLSPQLATLELMTVPKDESLLGAALGALLGGEDKAFSFTKGENPPMILLIFGRKRVLPVNINSMSVTETHFNTTLNPIKASVSLNMTVVEGKNLAFMYSKAMKEVMSVLNLANIGDVASVVVPM